MKTRHSLIKAIKAFSPGFVFLSLFPALSVADQFKVTRAIDGDSLAAVGHDMTIDVRLVGIDAPERSHKKYEPGQPYSRQANKYLAALVLNKTVETKVTHRTAITGS